jgi:hypothetical protein
MPVLLVSITKQAAHHAIVFMMQQVAVIHVRHYVIGKIFKAGDELNILTGHHQHHIFIASILGRHRGAIDAAYLKVHVRVCEKDVPRPWY